MRLKDHPFWNLQQFSKNKIVRYKKNIVGWKIWNKFISVKKQNILFFVALDLEKNFSILSTSRIGIILKNQTSVLRNETRGGIFIQANQESVVKSVVTMKSVSSMQTRSRSYLIIGVTSRVSRVLKYRRFSSMLLEITDMTHVHGNANIAK